jgi:hypothetical protein
MEETAGRFATLSTSAYGDLSVASGETGCLRLGAARIGNGLMGKRSAWRRFVPHTGGNTCATDGGMMIADQARRWKAREATATISRTATWCAYVGHELPIQSRCVGGMAACATALAAPAQIDGCR